MNLQKEGADMLLSEYLNLTDELDKKRVFDSTLDCDRPFFINLLRLRKADTPEFKNSYEKLNRFFDDIIILLHAAKSKGDSFCKQAYKQFHFSEVNETNLGFAKGISGQGFGDKLRKQVINDAYDIVKAGIENPRIFHLMELFEDNIGADRISDMISTIIETDIKKYTLRIWDELGVNSTNYPDIMFMNGFLLNPFKNNRKIYLLPVEILRELPIAADWDDIDRVVQENAAIRYEINQAVGKEWSKYSAHLKKAYIRKEIFENPEKCERILAAYDEEKAIPLDLKSVEAFKIDPDYYTRKLYRQFELQRLVPHLSKRVITNSHSFAIEELDFLGKYIYENKGWTLIQQFKTSDCEKLVQRLFDLSARRYAEENGFDLSFECDDGRGPVDVKISRGKDKTLIEIKLSSNGQYRHGYEKQLPAYGRAANTDSLIYLFIDKGNKGRLGKMKEICEEAYSRGEKAPELYLIDARIRESASKKQEEWDTGFDFILGDEKHYGIYDPGSLFDEFWS